MIIPESSERTVRIPVQWIDGRWQLIGGGALPELSPNACADLVIPAIFLTNDRQRISWTNEQRVQFLTAGRVLFTRVNSNRVPEPLLSKTEEKKHGTGHPSRFVKVILEEDAIMILTPGKKGRLLNAKCTIPALHDNAASLNEAVVKISRVFEPTRRSFGGSVFETMFVEVGDELVKLDVLRNRATAAAALMAARPWERCETWLELATTLSRVNEVWNHSDTQGCHRTTVTVSGHPEPIPLPEHTSDSLVVAASDFYDFRAKLLSRRATGLLALKERFHAPDDQSPDIIKLRELRAAMDRAVLEAYGWDDLAQTARCGWGLDCLDIEDDTFETPTSLWWPTAAEALAFEARLPSTGRGKKKLPWRLRWPDEFRDEVRARLLELNKQRHQEELLAGKDTKKKPRKRVTTRVTGTKDIDMQTEWF